jgi:hypothetical protein
MPINIFDYFSKSLFDIMISRITNGWLYRGIFLERFAYGNI